MIMLRYLLLSLYAVLFLSACGGGSRAEKSADDVTVVMSDRWQPPAAGTQVAGYKERVTEDDLNEKYFRVSVITTDSSAKGHYRLKLEYGYNINETEITLPEWTDEIIVKPVLQKGNGPYQCLLGFDTGDGVFRELYLISAGGGDIRLKQTQRYYKSS